MNYIALQRGSRGERYVVFYGCRGNQDLVFGHGHLPLSASRRVFLRLERIGERVSAFCSPDGKTWFGVGHVSFPAEDPLQVGLNAVGAINRTIYHGAYPDGTAIRFESFQLWGLNR